MSLKQQIINKIGFDPDNKQDYLNAVKQNGNSIQYIHNPSEEVQLEAVKEDGYSIQYINNPSIELQKLAIHNSGYNIKIIACCPSWEKFEDWIENNMMIKDIIE